MWIVWRTARSTHEPRLRSVLATNVERCGEVSITLESGGRHWLELGCGRRKFRPDFIGVDRLPLVDADGHQVPDIVQDLDNYGFSAATSPLRWLWARSDSCAFVIAHQTLEHIQNLIPFMNEVWRICDDDAWFEVIVPHYKSPAAFQDPTHVRFFTEMTLRYWEPGMVDDFSDYGIKGSFALADQRWREDGNLWALLRPLKLGRDVQYFRNWQALNPDVRPEYPMRGMCPRDLLDRCDGHKFLGGPK